MSCVTMFAAVASRLRTNCGGKLRTLTLTPRTSRGSHVYRAPSRAPLGVRTCATQDASPAKAMRKGSKRRLDEMCMELRPEHARNVLQSWIRQGKVLVDGAVVDKPGAQVRPTSAIEIRAETPKFVCRGGLKLEHALDHWSIDVQGKVALDSGLSTGGFTDCLLQRGARRVYGVDVGRGQVAEKIRQDARVVVMERTNLRYLTQGDLPEEVDIVSLDLSFISVLKVMPAVVDLMSDNAELIVLIKPQFEAGKDQVGDGGVVRDPAVHQQVLSQVITGIETHGFDCRGWTDSPIRGASKGNKEFLAYLVRRQ